MTNLLVGCAFAKRFCRVIVFDSSGRQNLQLEYRFYH